MGACSYFFLRRCSALPRRYPRHIGLAGDQYSYFPSRIFVLTPHYPAKSPLDDVFRLVAPGSDEFVTEKVCFEIRQRIERMEPRH